MTLGIEREGLGRPAARVRAQRHAGARHLRGDDHARPRAPRRWPTTRCRRNAFGRQIRSFEADLRIPGIDGPPVRAVFIRAPWIADAGEGVEVLASVDGHPVAARQDNMLVISFHPEIAGERRVHELFLAQVASAPEPEPEPRVFFVRHGESVANVFDRGGARPEDDGDRLSERGWEQARGLGRRLRGEGIETIVASPMRRAQETAAGDQRGPRPAARAPTTSCSRSASPTRSTPPARRAPSTRRWPGCRTAPPRRGAAPGAESFDDIVGRVSRVHERLEARRRRARPRGQPLRLPALPARADACSATTSRPSTCSALYRLGHANTGISIFTRHEQRVHRRHPVPRLGADDLERSRAPVAALALIPLSPAVARADDTAPAAGGDRADLPSWMRFTGRWGASRQRAARRRRLWRRRRRRV